jgi:hypothetical protein
MPDKIDDWLTGKSDAETPAAATATSPADRIDAFLNPSVEETKSPTTKFLGEGSPAMQAWRSYQAAGSLHNWLAPAPDTEYSSTPLVPFAKDTKTGETRLALPGPLRNFLYSATGDLSEGMTADPTTGRFGTTPEMGSAINMLAGAGARPTGFSRPLSAVPLAEREAAAAGKPPPEAPYEFRDIKPVAPGPSDRPTGPSERVPPDLPTEAVRSSATAKIAEDARYGDVTRSSDITSMDAVNRAVDNAIPQDEAAAARREFGKDSVVTKQIDNLQGIKDRELTVQRWKGYDQSFSDDIQTLIKQGNSAAARQLQIIQQRMRNQIENPFGDDLTSGDGNGFASLKVARQTSAQRQKMEDVERMMALAKGRKVPQTSVQSQITNFKNNEAKSRGWSDDEMAALTKAAETGEFGDLMHTLGSKLAPAIGLGPAIAESLFTHEAPSALGMAAGVPVATATYYLGKGARGIENMLLRRRMQNALDVLGQSVPTNPLNMPP